MFLVIFDTTDLMSQKLQPARGTQDLLPEISRAFRLIDNTGFDWASRYGFEEIDTPIFEFSEVFHRTLGETSDVVSKETYTFQDRGNESLTLRPEGTAGIARAFISNGLQQNLPLKFYYSGPMFRYERPQKGRYRQFHQLGVESLGLESPIADVECIALGADILKALGLKDKLQLEINTLGDSESRTRHKDLLVGYLAKYEKELSAESQIRLHKNPLRILDSKDANDQKLVSDAPTLASCLNDVSKQFFDQVLRGLQNLNLEIPIHVSNNLVRGLDYYTHSVFEFTTSHLGAQGTVLAGGRYDGLIEQMGGPRTPGVGWASGMERLSLLVSEQGLPAKSYDYAVITADSSADALALQISHALRSKGKRVEIVGGNKMGKKLARADKLGAQFAVILGETEVRENKVTLKDLKAQTQNTVPLKEFLS